MQRPPAEKDTLTGYYLGFPILGDLLRGWMWKLTGWPESVNLLGIISLLLLFGYLKWAYRQIEIAWAPRPSALTPISNDEGVAPVRAVSLPGMER